MLSLKLHVLLGVTALQNISSFSIVRPLANVVQVSPFGQKTNRPTLTSLFGDSIDVDFEEEEEAEPGRMRVAEIKSELDLRGIDYKDCFDKVCGTWSLLINCGYHF